MLLTLTKIFQSVVNQKQTEENKPQRNSSTAYFHCGNNLPILLLHKVIENGESLPRKHFLIMEWRAVLNVHTRTSRMQVTNFQILERETHAHGDSLRNKFAIRQYVSYRNKNSDTYGQRVYLTNMIFKIILHVLSFIGKTAYNLTVRILYPHV